MTASASRFDICCRLIVFALAILPAAVGAAEIVVDSAWLSDRIHDPKLVLLHVGDQETFDKEHIPRAQRIDVHGEFSDPNSHSDGSLILEMPSATQFEQTLEQLGVSDDSVIVTYWSDDQITQATRALFTLQWAGLGENAHFLDGGLDAWIGAGGETTTDIVNPHHGSVTLSPRPELVVNAAWIEENTESRSIVLVDGRSRAYFDGVSESGGKSGHIPGAGSTPWTDLVDGDLHLKDEDSLREAFSSAGINRGDTVVAYCHIGQYATMVLLAARTLGHEVRLYDGAFQDWAARGLPVSTR